MIKYSIHVNNILMCDLVEKGGVVNAVHHAHQHERANIGHGHSLELLLALFHDLFSLFCTRIPQAVRRQPGTFLVLAQVGELGLQSGHQRCVLGTAHLQQLHVVSQHGHRDFGCESIPIYGLIFSWNKIKWLVNIKKQNSEN